MHIEDVKDCCVYRYIDVSDWKIKYVGITVNGTLVNRHKGHIKEEWYKNGRFICEYIQVDNQSEAEAIESHLIALYDTGKYFNKAKTGWGINKYLPNEYNWKVLNLHKSMNEIANILSIRAEWCLTKTNWDKNSISKFLSDLSLEITRSQEEQKNIQTWKTRVQPTS